MARLGLPPRRLRRAKALVAGVLLCLSGCGGDYVRLGSSEPLLVGGDAGAGATSGTGGQTPIGGSSQTQEWLVSPPLLDQQANLLFANPTFTASLQELYFTYQERGTDEPYLYRAEAMGSGWGSGQELRLGTATKTVAASPAISLSGDALWFAAPGDTSLDVWVSSGGAVEWEAPVLVPELSSDADDLPRPPGGPDQTIMPLSSKRHGGKLYQIYFATRASTADPWQAPTQEHLASINVADAESIDGFLSADGLTLYFSSSRLSHSIVDEDLFRAYRASIDEDFGEPELVPPDVNLPTTDERDPWLTADGKRLYFTSDRTGEYGIYSAESLK